MGDGGGSEEANGVGMCSRMKQFYEETHSHVSIPPYQDGTMAKDAWCVRKVYWRRERAHDKTGKRVIVSGVLCRYIYMVSR